MLSVEQGKTYEFQLHDGSTLTVRYEGMGGWMETIWVDPATGARVTPLPPYVSCRQID